MMRASAERSRRRPAIAVLRLLLVLALLLPLGVLFDQAWRSADEQEDYATRERHGIEYLRSLGQVTVALIDTQSAAVAGRQAPPDALRKAIEATDAVDARLGAGLRSQGRWAGLRAKIQSLSDQGGSDPPEVFAAYREATDLLLALYAKVREGSGLVRDPGADSYHLQAAVGEDLPATLVSAGRLTDLTLIATNTSPDDHLRTELTAARPTMLAPATDLVDNLQAAVANTESRTLGLTLLSWIDRYRRAVEALATAATPDSNGSVDPNRVTSLRDSAQAAAAELSETLLTELEALIGRRLADVADQRRLTAGAAGLAVALIFVAAVAEIVGAWRARRPGRRPAQDPPGMPSPDSQPGLGDRLARMTESATGADRRPGPVTVRQYDQLARWGRSGAAR